MPTVAIAVFGFLETARAVPHEDLLLAVKFIIVVKFPSVSIDDRLPASTLLKFRLARSESLARGSGSP